MGYNKSDVHKKRGSGSVTSAASSGTRGVRNNNPGNIRKGSSTWEGEIGVDDKGFIVFSSMNYGVRACMKLIRNYIMGGTNTIRKIINRYAPPTDNNPTESYIAYVSTQCNIGSNTVISSDDWDKLCKLVVAICYFESRYIVPSTEYLWAVESLRGGK